MLSWISFDLILLNIIIFIYSASARASFFFCFHVLLNFLFKEICFVYIEPFEFNTEISIQHCVFIDDIESVSMILCGGKWTRVICFVHVLCIYVCSICNVDLWLTCLFHLLTLFHSYSSLDWSVYILEHVKLNWKFQMQNE